MNDHAEFSAELPGGGHIRLQSSDELDRWNVLSSRYQAEYSLVKINDLTALGTLLQFHMSLYRAQVALSGMEPEIDDEDLPTGRMKAVTLKPADHKRLTEQLNSASKEIRAIEQAMGIDAKSRSQTGSETVLDWITRLKDAGHKYGVHISKRVHLFEEFSNELRWRLRLMENGDAEDRAYHECHPEGILKWAKEQLDALEESDKKFATENTLVVGRVH